MEGFSENTQLFFLILARAAGLVFVAPVLNTDSVGYRSRMMISVLLAALLYPAAVNYLPALPDTIIEYALAVLSQAFVGIVIGFFILIIFSAFQLTGEIFSMQMGISFSEVLDPQSNVSIPLLGTLKNTIGILLFLYVPFVMDGHYIPAYLHMIRALGFSFQAIPELLPNIQTLGGILLYLDQAFGIMFLTAVKIGIPLIGILFITSLMLGLLGRAAPQMNLMNMGIQLNISVGVVVLMFLIPVIVPLMLESFQVMYDRLGEMYKTWPRSGV
ncbi:MAG: flagellar biosynthetic protein FliR [bacterium]|nr:flagellar biosynthetic protein FliR [bacterium]